MAIAAPWSSSRTASKKAVALGGEVPVGVRLGLALGLDVAAELDQGDHPEQPGAIEHGRGDGEPGRGVAEVPGGLGTAGGGDEVQPGAGQEELGGGLLGAGLADAVGQGLVGPLERRGEHAPVGVDELAVELVAVQRAMASRASSHRGEPAGMAAQRARRALAVGCMPTDSSPSSQRASSVAGSAGKSRTCRSRASVYAAIDAPGWCAASGTAARQGAEHPGAGPDGPGGRVVGDARERQVGLDESARLEEERPGAEPVAGRRRGLAGRRGRGPRPAISAAAAFAGLAGPLIGVGQRVPGVRRLARARLDARPRQLQQRQPRLRRLAPLQRADLPEQLGVDAAVGPCPSGVRRQLGQADPDLPQPLDGRLQVRGLDRLHRRRHTASRRSSAGP